MAPNKNQNDKSPLKKGTNWNYWLLLPLLLLLLVMLFNKDDEPDTITSKRFEQQMLKGNDVLKIEIVNERKVLVYLKGESLDKPDYHDLASNASQQDPHYTFNIGSMDVFHRNLDKAQQDIPEADRIEITYTTETNWVNNLFSWVLPFALLAIFWMVMMGRFPGAGGTRGRSIFNFSKSGAREMDRSKVKRTTFKDVAGLEEAKEEIYELVRFLKNPKKYGALGAKIPKGVLLVGPPGTGKTLLAKAVAGETGVPFFSLSGSEFIEMFVGVGASRMRDLFEKAKAKAPSIIFIDEIDTVGRSRGRINAFQSNDERESTLNQLLAELDGFDTDTGVIVLAATNRGDVLDPALLRPGRFDRHIHLELPNLKERIAIFKVHIAPLVIDAKLNIEALAGQTPGFSGADISNICNEAALIATRKENMVVEQVDFMDAIDRVVGGLEKKSKIISAVEKERIAYHEAGHVTTGWFLEHSSPILKVSIIPRGKSLGAAWYLPDEHQIITKSEFLDTICMTLGGRAAEEVFFGEASSNAVDDLEKVTKQAYSMVAIYGLGDDIRNLSYYDSSGQTDQTLHKPYSDKTAAIIDHEVQEIVDEAYNRAKDILISHKDKIDKLAQALITKEVIYREGIAEILGEHIAGTNTNNVGISQY